MQSMSNGKIKNCETSYIIENNRLSLTCYIHYLLCRVCSTAFDRSGESLQRNLKELVVVRLLKQSSLIYKHPYVHFVDLRHSLIGVYMLIAKRFSLFSTYKVPIYTTIVCDTSGAVFHQRKSI